MFATAPLAHSRPAAQMLTQPRKVETTRLRLCACVSEVVAQSLFQCFGQNGFGRAAEAASRATFHLAMRATDESKAARKSSDAEPTLRMKSSSDVAPLLPTLHIALLLSQRAGPGSQGVNM